MLISVFDWSNNDISSYGCLIGTKKYLCASFREILMPTYMGRKLLIAELTKQKIGVVATVHLESLNSE